MDSELDDLLKEYDHIFVQVASIENVAVLICERIYTPPVHAWYEIHLLPTVISGELVDENNTEYSYYFEIPLTVFFGGIDVIDEFILEEQGELLAHSVNAAL